MSSTTASVALENNYEGKSRLMQEFIDLKDNVKDQIFKLKQDIKDDKKKEKWDQSFEKINKTFNDLVERNFDNFINDNYRKYEKFLKDGKLDADETKQMEDDFNVFMQETFESDNSFVNILNQLKEFEQEATFRTTRLELNGLRVETESEGLKKSINTNAVETRDKKNTYNYKPENFSMTELGDKGKIKYEYPDIDLDYNNEDLINIFKKGGLFKLVEGIVGDLGGLDKRTFNINLSPEHGLSGLVSYIEENNLWGDITGPGDIKKLAKRTPGFEYNRDGGIDRERRKIAQIIQAANNDSGLKERLLDFAEKTKSYGSGYEKRLKQEFNFRNNLGSIGADNILQSLCDFNGDGKLAINLFQYRQRKEHMLAWKKEHQPDLPHDRREQRKKEWQNQKEKEKQLKKEGKDIENLGDVGTIFGPQLYDAIQTAGNVLETRIKYGDRGIIDAYGTDVRGENIVIFNIIKAIRFTNQSAKIESILKTLTVKDCTKDKLLTLCQEHSEFQPLFALAIERINGSSSKVAPDLVDKLSGVERLPLTEKKKEQKEEKKSFSELSTVLVKDRTSTTDVGKKFVADYHEEGILYMKKGIMTMLDNVNFGAMLNDQGKLLSLGIDKSRDLEKRRHELENSFAKTLLGALAVVTFDPTTLSLGVQFGQSGATADLKNLRSRNINISNLIGTPIFKINLGGEFAHQFNYPGVVTGSLDDISSAKYIGVDGGVGEVFVGAVPTISIAEGGIEFKNNSKAAIEQMYKQYNAVTSILFDLNNDDSKSLRGATESDVSSKENLTKFLERRYENLYTSLNALKSGKKNNLMADFLKSNKNFIHTNIQQLATSFETSGVFAAISADEKTDKVKATKTILNIFQEGITNEWRETMYERIAGKKEISKVGIGIGAAFIAQTIPTLYPKLSFKLTNWRNNYINNKGQKLLDATLIGGGGIEKKFDVFTPEPPTMEAYAAYIKAIFNIPGKLKDKEGKEILDDKGNSIDILETGVTKEGFLYVRYNGTAVDRITDIIDVRSKVKQDVLDNIKISEDSKTLILGDVGNITAYTQSDGEGKRCFLILGGEKAENTTRLNPELHKENMPKQGITLDKFDGTYKTWSKENIKSEIVDKFVKTPDDADGTLLLADKEILLKFFADNGTIQDPKIEGITIVDNNKLIGTKLSTGTLKIEKSADGKSYALGYNALPADKLSIEFIDLTKVERVEKKTEKTVEKNFEVGDVLINFDGTILKAQEAINNIPLSSIANLERKNKAQGILDPNFTKLTTAAFGRDYITAKKCLLGLLNKEKNACQAVITLLAKSTDQKTIAYIVKRFVAILAYEDVYQDKTIGKIVAGRTNMSAGLKGPSGDQFSPELKKEFRGSSARTLGGQRLERSQLTEEYTDKKTEKSNTILGYTAFYRKNNQTGYMMMSLGDTNIISESKKTISDENQTAAQTWLIDNMRKEGPETEILLENIKNILPQEQRKGFTQEKMFELLENGSIVNGAKTITLEKEAVFYLMAECVNESIGLKINKLTVEETKEENVYKQYSAQGAATENKVASTKIAGRNLSSSMKVGSYAEETGLELSLVKTEKKSDDESGAGLGEKPVDDESGADLESE